MYTAVMILTVLVIVLIDSDLSLPPIFDNSTRRNHGINTLQRLWVATQVRAAATNADTFCRSFVWVPSLLSVLVLESTPAGHEARIASRTFSDPNPPRNDDGRAHTFDDTPVELPAMGHAQGPDLAIARLVTIEKKKIGDPVVGTSEGDAVVVNYGDAAHQQDRGKLAF